MIWLHILSPALVAAAQREQLTYGGFLAELLLAECDDRDRRRSARRLKAAGFPREKWLADFDCTANPNIEPAVIANLATCAWIIKGEPLALSDRGLRHRQEPPVDRPGSPRRPARAPSEVRAGRKLVNELVEAADEKHQHQPIAAGEQ